jgi:glycosyltransferase involved in cell wall biosynthesis
MDWRKGIDLFIQVANFVDKNYPDLDIGFCWIGSSVARNSYIEYIYEIELLSLGKRFKFLGETADVNSYMADLDLFLLTSREDPFPLVMLEAARQGIPICCFENSGGAIEFVDQKTGIIMPMLDIAGMSQAVVAFSQNIELCRSVGEEAYLKSLNFNTEKMGSMIEIAIQDFLIKYDK